MTVPAFVFMSTAIVSVTALAVWCYLKILTGHGTDSRSDRRDD